MRPNMKRKKAVDKEITTQLCYSRNSFIRTSSRVCFWLS